MLFLLLLPVAVCGGGYYAYLTMKYGVRGVGEVVFETDEDEVFYQSSTFEQRNGFSQTAKETMPGYYPETGHVVVG